ncbi:hypothetical protein L6R52_19930, partial [Myxococcota bacterium]|nr:hypothetical protein [Myxococcota bacterium]
PARWVARPSQGALRLAARLPDGARLFSGALDGKDGALVELAADAPERARITSDVTLALPVDHGRCREPGVGTLVPFGRSRSITAGLADQTKDARAIVRARWIDEARAVAVTVRYALFVERGRDVALVPVRPGQRGGYFDPLDVEPGIASSFTDMVVDRSRGTPIVIAVGAVAEDERRTSGRVWELAVHDDGLELVRTTTLTFGPEAIAVDAAGAVALVEYGLYVETRAPGAARFVSLPRLEAAPDHGLATHRITWTGDAREPLVASTADRLHVYDAEAAAWRATDLPFASLAPGTPLDPTRDKVVYRALTSRAAPDGVETWAGGHFGALFRRPARGAWSRVDYLAPPGYSGCARPVGNYPDVLMSSIIDDVAFDGDHLYVAFRECSAVLGIRVADLCAETLGLEGLEPAPSDTTDLQSVDLLNGKLLVAGESGQLYAE